jgi:hypothetical protein
MLLENVVSPAYLPAANGDPRPDGGRQRINYLKVAFADEGQATAVLAEITSRVVEATAGDCTSQGIQNLTEAFPAIVSEVLAARGVHEYHEQIVNLIKENPIGCLLQYASDACGLKTFRDLRAAFCARAFLPFERARAFVHSLQLKSAAEWRDYCGSGKKPEDIPTNPHAAYEDAGWVGYGDWLGTGRARDFRPYLEARQFAHELGLRSQREWIQYCNSGRKPPDIPSCPDKVYERSGWTSLGDWLGTGTVHPGNRIYRPFPEARRHVQALQLKGQQEWRLYCKSGQKPAAIPANPDNVYRETGWNGYGDWLGTGRVATREKAYRSFHDARNYVHDLQLRSAKEWHD